MHAINFTRLSTAQVVAMADGLFRAKDFQAAANLYALALEQAQPEQKNGLRVRLGLAKSPSSRSLITLEALEALEQITNDVFISEGLATWMKTMPFSYDERFLALADKHSGLLPIPNWH